MRQIFLLILLFIVGNWLVKAVRRAESKASARTGSTSSGPAPGDTQRASKAAQLAEPMIRCAECGVHAPKSDSVVVAGQPFCSADHAHRHAARPSGRDAR